MASETSPIVAGLLVHRLAISPKHLSFSVRDLAPAIRQFAKLSRDSDLTRFCTYLMLTELNLIPKKPQPAGALVLRHLRLPVIAGKQSLLSAFFQDLFAVGINLDWERFLGRRAHSEAQRRSIVIRGRWSGNPSLLITALDSFNDLLIQRFSTKHRKLNKAFRRAAGKNKIPNYANWLSSVALQTALPNTCPLLLACHRLRVLAHIAHATQQKTGRFTRPISYKESQKMVKQLRMAYRELLNEWTRL